MPQLWRSLDHEPDLGGTDGGCDLLTPEGAMTKGRHADLIDRLEAMARAIESDTWRNPELVKRDAGLLRLAIAALSGGDGADDLGSDGA